MATKKKAGKLHVVDFSKKKAPAPLPAAQDPQYVHTTKDDPNATGISVKEPVETFIKLYTEPVTHVVWRVRIPAMAAWFEVNVAGSFRSDAKAIQELPEEAAMARLEIHFVEHVDIIAKALADVSAEYRRTNELEPPPPKPAAGGRG